LGDGEKFGSLDPHFLGRHLDIATPTHMTVIDTEGGINKYPHHKQVLSTFSDVDRTTISNKRNWNCNQVIVREVLMPCDGVEDKEGNEEGSEDNDNEGEEEGQEAQ